MAIGHSLKSVVTAALLAALAIAPASAVAADGITSTDSFGFSSGSPEETYVIPKQPRVVLALVPRLTLDEAAALPGASVGYAGATQGRYRPAQAILDISQGARTSLREYDPDDPVALRVAGDHIEGWSGAVARADAAPATVRPGLLGSAIPGGAAAVDAAFVGEGAGRAHSLSAAEVAADRAGRFTPAATLFQGLERRRVVVIELRSPAQLHGLSSGLRQLKTTLIALALPPPAHDAQLLPMAVVGGGLRPGRELTSQTTRTDGLVTAIDVAPTILHALGLPIPHDMTGEPVTTAGPIDLHALRTRAARLRVINGRRGATWNALAAAWLLAVALGAIVRRRAGARAAVRAGGLAVLWTPSVLLLTAALRPDRTQEVLAVALGGLALGALTDRFAPWPRAPLVPAAVGLLAYTVDLAFGSPLIATSLLGPNPLFGSRFYGLGNELEAVLPVLALTGTAAALTTECRLTSASPRSGDTRRPAVTFAAVGLALGLVVGSGRLGADVGGVITVGAAAAVAVVLALPGPPTRRRIVLAAAVPVLAVLALAALDLATGGDSHFTRTVLRAQSSQDLGDVASRRFELAFSNLRRGLMPLLTALALAAIVAGIRRRDQLLAGLPDERVWQATLAGCAAAGIAGALANDSGPELLVYAMVLTAAATAYLRAGAPPRS